MKRRTRKLLFISMVTAMLLSILPVQVLAEETESGLPAFQTVELPIVQEGADAGGNSAPLPRSSFSLQSLTPYEENMVYAYQGTDEIFINKTACIGANEPDPNGILQLVDSNGDVVPKAASDAITSDWFYEDDKYYIWGEDIYNARDIPSGVYKLQMSAGNEIYSLTGVEVTVVSSDKLFIEDAYIDNLYPGQTPEVGITIFGFSTEAELSALTFTLKDANDVLVAVSTGSYRDLSTNYSDGGWRVYAQLELESGQTIIDEGEYSLSIGYNGTKDLVVGVSSVTSTAYVPDVSIAEFEITDPQKTVVAVTLANWDPEETYKIEIASDGYEGTVFGRWEGTVPADGVVENIRLSINGVTTQATSYPDYLCVLLYDGVTEVELDWLGLENTHGNGSFGWCSFRPNFIKSTASSVPFVIDYGETNYIFDTGNILSMRNDKGEEVGFCSDMVCNPARGGSTLSGTLSIQDNLEASEYYLYLNGVSFDTVEVTNVLSLYTSVPMADYIDEEYSFWTNLGIIPVEVDAINSSGSGEIVFRQGDTDVLSSGRLTGEESEYYDHLLFKHSFTREQLNTALTPGESYTLVFRDSEGAEIVICVERDMSYVAAVTPIDCTSLSVDIEVDGLVEGDDAIPLRIYFGDAECPKNVTEDAMNATLKTITLSNGTDTFAVTEVKNGKWTDGMYRYDLELVLNKPLTAGEYTLYQANEKVNTFTVDEPDIDNRPYIGNGDSKGFIHGENLSVGTYTGKLFQGYTCLTPGGFPLTLSDTGSGNTTQYLYFSNSILKDCAAGEYEIWVYKDESILGVADLTLLLSAAPIVLVEDDDGDWNDTGSPLMDTRTVFISTDNLGTYGYLRYAETQDDLDRKDFKVCSHNSFYVHTFEGEEGLRTLYVELSKTGNPEDKDNKMYDFDLWLCTDSDVDVQVPEGIVGTQNPIGYSYTITATAELPAIKLWISFYDIEGAHASKQMTYAGPTKDGRYEFSMDINIYSSFYDDNYTNSEGESDFYFKDTCSIRVFATDLSDAYNENEAYSGNVVGRAVERILRFTDLTGIVLPLFENGVALTNQSSYTMTGYATPSSTVRIYDGEATEPLVQASVNSNGYFTALLSGLTEGTHSLRVTDSVFERSATLIMDLTPPVIESVGFTFLNGGSAVVRWVCTDVDVDYYNVYKNGILLGRAFAGTDSYNVAASPGDNSSFTIRAYDKAGNTGEKTATTADTEPPTAPPAAPTASLVTTTGLTLTWTSGTDNLGIGGYNVYQDSEKIAELDGADVLSYNVTELSQGTEYGFTIKTRDRAGNLSDGSTALTVSTVELSIEGTMEEEYTVDVQEYADNKRIPVSFNVVGDAENYEVTLTDAQMEYRAASAAPTDDWISAYLSSNEDTASGSWDISGSGTDGYIPMGSYHVRFKATDSNGAAVVSDPVLVVLLKFDDIPPTIPGTPTADSHSTTTITFHWEESTDNVGVDHYEVHRGGTKVGESATNSYTDTELTMDTDYTYTIKAVDARENKSGLSTPATLSTMALEFESYTDFADSYVMDEQDNKEISVQAKLRPQEDYTPEISMKLEYKLTSANEWTEEALAVDWDDENLFKGVWPLAGDDDGYLSAGDYSVRFSVSDGEVTAYSEVQTVELAEDTTPPVVSAFTPASGIFGGTKKVPLSAEATDNVSVARIDLSYAPTGGMYTEITTFSNEDGYNRFNGSYSWDASALASGDYTIRAVAYDLRGNASEDVTKSIIIDNTPPDDVSNCTVTGTSRYIHVMWDYAPLPAVNDFDSFRVYRSESASEDFVQISSSTSRGYYDDGEEIEKGKEYFYYVTAIDDYGNENEGSDILSATLIADNESPTIGDMRPSVNAAFCKSTTIKVTASDNYRLAKAVFEYQAVGSEDWNQIVEIKTDKPTNSTIFSHTWDISDLQTGSYEIRVSVYDDSINDVAENGSIYTANPPAVGTRIVQIRAYNLPVAPENVVAVEGYKSAVLSWTYLGSLDTLRSFNVYSCDASGENRNYKGSAKAGATGSFSVSIPASGAQYFVVAACDDYNAVAYSDVVSVTSLAGETEAPVAVIMPEMLTATAGTAFTFSGAMSTDNDVIASYAWDFGDSSPTGSGKSVNHTYTQAGEYTVQLTVTDACDNSGIATKTMHVYDVTGENATHARVSLKTVNGYVAGTPGIGGAEMKVFSDGFETTVTTDNNGNATAIVPIGSHIVSAVAQGYIAATRTMKVTPDENGSFSWTLAMTPMNVSTVDGSLTYSEMTDEEIQEAGIDVTDPGNQHVSKVAVKLSFQAGPVAPFEVPVTAYFNEAGEFIDGTGWGWFSFWGSGGGGGSGGGSGGGTKIGLFPISENLILIIYGEARWLKEMYNVELLVINNSYADDITDCVAKLELPEGLSLAAMNGVAQSATIDLDTIAKKTAQNDGANTAKAIWYVRGDVEGEYALTATVTGCNPEPFLKTFTTDKPLKVYAGTALKLFITAEDIAFRGEEYHVQFKLQNVSHKELYNLSFGITGAEQYKATVIGNSESEMSLTQEDFGGGMTQSIKTLSPGDSIIINFTTTTWFNSITELTGFGPFDVGYYLTDVVVTTLEGSTTTIPYEVSITHVPHGSFFEWLMGEAKGGVADLIDKYVFMGVPITSNTLKAYELKLDDSEGAASTATITLEQGGVFTETRSYVRSFSADVVEVYTDAPAGSYNISADGRTMTLNESAKLYVLGKSEGKTEVTVTTHTLDIQTDKFEPNVYKLEFEVSGDAGTASSVVLQEPESSTIAVPLAGETADISFPYALLDSGGALLGGAENAEWTITGANTIGLSVENGVVTVASNAKGGVYTLRLSLSEDVYAEQSFTLTREESVATTVQLSRDNAVLSLTDTLVVPVSEESEAYAYTAKLLDQYGVEMDADFTWQTTENTSGVIPVGGDVTLTKDSTLGTFTLTASAQDKSAEVVVTVTNLAVDWSGVDAAIAAATYTYGDRNDKVVLPTSGTATAVGTVNGVFTYTDEDVVQDAGARTITVVFTVTDEGGYNNTAISKDYNVNIGKKALADSMIHITGSYTYTGVAVTPGYTVSDDELLTVDDYTAECSNNVEAGNGTVIATATASGNYSGSASSTFAIGKADITGIQTTAPSHRVYANDEVNTGTAALKAIANSGEALPGSVTVTFGENLTASLPIVWADSADTFSIKGGNYTYFGTVTVGNNFNAYTDALDAVVTVAPVYGFIEQSLADNYVPYATAQSADNFGLYPTVDVVYNAAADGSGAEIITDTSLTTDVAVNWTPNVTALAMAVGNEQAFTIASGLPAWATFADSDRRVVITDKYPVTVTVTAPAGVTYGTALGDPVPSQAAIDNGTDDSATYTYRYTGTTAAGADYSSPEKPTQAGSYAISATLSSNTHAGSGVSSVFTISPKALTDDMLNISGSYTYTSSALTPSYTVTDGELLAASDYTAEVSNNVNAGSGATVAIIGKNNYTGSISKTFTILPASIAAVQPSIVGNGTMGQTLTGQLDVVGFNASDFTWQWERDSVNVGEDSNIYTLTADDSGSSITLVVSAKSDTNHTGNSLASEPVAIAKMSVSGTLTIAETNGDGAAGIIDVGDSLTAGVGGVMPAQAQTGGSFQWFNDSSDTPVATGAEYIVATGDADSVLRVVYTPSEKFSDTVSASIEVGKAVLTGTLTISGTPDVGEILTASFTTPATEGYDLVWLRDGVTIADGGGTTYTVAKADQGKIIMVKAVSKGKYTGEVLAESGIVIPADVPDAPVLRTTAGNAQVTLNWVFPFDNGAPVTGYELYMGGELIAKIAASSTNYTVTELVNGTQYNFVLRVSNSEGYRDSMIATATPATPSNPNGSGGAGGAVAAPADEPSDATIEQEAVVSGNAATMTVSTDAVRSAIEAAQNQNTDAVTIIPTDTGAAASVTVSVPKAATQNIADEDMTLNVETVNGTVSISTVALTAIANQAAGNSIDIVIESKSAEEIAGELDEAELRNAVAVQVTLVSGDTKITSFGGQSIAINLPVTATTHTEGESYKVIVVSENGERQILAGQCVRIDGKLYVRVTTEHLSTFIATSQKLVPFTDVEGHWGYNAITYVHGNGLMDGVGNRLFDPNGTMNRAMLVTILYRLEGKPEGSATNSFSDVAVGQWYTDAVVWANTSGIVNGIGDGSFAPTACVTREQMAAILYRYAQYKNYNMAVADEIATYTDAETISAWALDALKWANGTGIITGRSSTTIAPAGTATRAEAATILMRFIEDIAK